MMDVEKSSGLIGLMTYALRLLLVFTLLGNGGAVKASDKRTDENALKMVSASGLVFVFKSASVSTLFPQLNPNDERYRSLFKCAINSDGKKYAQALKDFYLRTFNAEEIGYLTRFFSTALWQKFLRYQKSQIGLQLAQSFAENYELPQDAASELEKFFGSPAGKYFSIDNLAKLPELMGSIFAAHSETIRNCQGRVN